MSKDERDSVLTTREACDYLRICRPTYLKYLYAGKIKGVKVGKGWKVLKSELTRFLKGEFGDLNLVEPRGPAEDAIKQYLRSQKEA